MALREAVHQPRGLPAALFARAIRSELDGENDDGWPHQRERRAAGRFTPTGLDDGCGRKGATGKDLALHALAGSETHLRDADAARPGLRRRTMRDEAQQGEKGKNDPLHPARDIGGLPRKVQPAEAFIRQACGLPPPLTRSRSTGVCRRVIATPVKLGISKAPACGGAASPA